MRQETTSRSEGLLRRLAKQLLTASARVPDVLALQDHTADPIARYILAQGVKDPDEFQLPEPILHPIDHPDVLVVGFNPNYGEDEVIPRYGSTLEEYIGFYADRFVSCRRDAAGRPAGQRLGDGAIYSIGHYSQVEHLVSEVLGIVTALGVNTVYCDAIPWKWKQDDRPKKKDIDFGQASDRLETIVTALQPRVILTLGGDASGIIADWRRDKPRPRPVHPSMHVPQVASYHPAARNNAFKRHLGEVQEALRRALLRTV